MAEYEASHEAGVGWRFQAKDHDSAIEWMKDQMILIHESPIPRYNDEKQLWILYLVEREEFPELHDALDPHGAYHNIFVHKCSIGADGTIEDDETEWNESVDISFEESNT